LPKSTTTTIMRALIVAVLTLAAAANAAPARAAADPDMRVVASHDGGEGLLRGARFTYSVVVTNHGDAVASAVEVHAGIPTALQVINLLPTLDGGGCSVVALTIDGAATQAVHCTRKSLDAGASATLTVDVLVRRDARCGTLRPDIWVAARDEPRGNVGSDNRASAPGVVKCTPSIALDLLAPAAAHRGDRLTYRFGVRNDGEGPLRAVGLTAPACEAAPIVNRRGNGDDVLSQGERWSFSCTRAASSSAGDRVGVTGWVVGLDENGAKVRASSRVVVDVLHPAVAIAVSAPPSASPGERITLRYRVTNTGDAPLRDVHVRDGLVGAVTTIPTLLPGRWKVVTASAVIVAGASRSVATVDARDALGRVVRASDTERFTLLSVPSSRSGGGTAFTGSPAGAGAAFALSVLLALLGMTAIHVTRRRSV
jgi:hypothetical protein